MGLLFKTSESKQVQTRKTLTLTTGVFGISSLAFGGYAVYKIVKSLIFGGGLFAALGTFSFWGLLALIFVLVPMFRGAYKSYGDLDYAKSKRKAWVSTLGAVGLAVIEFLL